MLQMVHCMLQELQEVHCMMQVLQEVNYMLQVVVVVAGYTHLMPKDRLLLLQEHFAVQVEGLHQMLEKHQQQPQIEEGKTLCIERRD